MAETFPIFPLSTVLYPGMPLLLHIFEPRYRIMIGRCVDEGSPIGIFCISEGSEALGPIAEPHRIGTLAQIRSVHKQPDGRSHVELLGDVRIRLESYESTTDGYALGRCELLEEDLSEQPSEPDRMLFESRLRQLLELNGAIPGDPVLLCHSALRLLDLPLPEKQHLLEIDRFGDRWNETARRLQQKLEYRMLARKLSAGDSYPNIPAESLN